MILITYWYALGNDVFPQFSVFKENATDEEIIQNRRDPKIGEFIGYETRTKF